MSHDWVFETWLTELAVGPRHQARRTRAEAPRMKASSPPARRRAEPTERWTGPRTFEKRRTSC